MIKAAVMVRPTQAGETCGPVPSDVCTVQYNTYNYPSDLMRISNMRDCKTRDAFLKLLLMVQPPAPQGREGLTRTGLLP